MATVIDQFIVTLGLDPTDYQRGQKKARDEGKKTKDEALRDSKEIEAGARKMREVVANVRREVIGLFAAFTAGAGLKDFIAQTITTDAATGRLAKQLGVATEELSAWQGVARRLGGTSEDGAQAVFVLADAFQQLQLTGQSPLIPYLQLLGISMAELENPTETLFKIADAFKQMDPQRAAALGRGMGFSPTTVSALLEGGDALKALIEEQKRLGVTTAADAKAAQELQARLSGLKDASSRLGRDLLTAAVPALERAGQLLTDLLKWAQSHGATVQGAFIGLAAAAALLAAPLIASVAPFLAAAAAIAAISAGIGFLIDDFQTFKEGGPSSIDWGPFESAIESVSGTLASIRTAFTDAFAEIQKAFDSLDPAALDVLRGLFETLRIQLVGWSRTFAAVAAFVGGILKLMADGFVLHFKVIVGLINTVAALLRGDWKGAFESAKKIASDVLDGLKKQFETITKTARDMWDAITGKKSPKPAASSAPMAPAAFQGDAKTQALKMIRDFEKFIPNAKWDENAYRVGYGSDTVTDPRTGKVSRVTKNTRGVTVAMAEADLYRRVTGEFMPIAAKASGEQWSKFQPTTQAALTSLAYNWGRIVPSVKSAIRTGDEAKIANAIERLGIGAKYEGLTRRRIQEANAIRAALPANDGQNSVIEPGLMRGAQVAMAGRAGPTANDNRVTTDVRVGQITVQTQATDANGIARDIGQAVQKRAFVTQANTGL